MRLRLRKPLLAQVLLLTSFLGAFGFLGFYPALGTFEAGLASVLILYVWLALSTTIDSRWAMYAFLPAFGLAVFVLFYALVFTSRVDASLLPSVISQRDYVFLLLAPVVYMLLRVRGWELADLRRVFVLAMLMALASRVLADFTLPTGSAPSGGFLALKPDTAYGEESSLLRRLDTSAVFCALYFGRGIPKSKDVLSLGFRVSVTALAVTLLLVNAPRTLLASALLAIVLYAAFFSRPLRARFSVLLLPPVALLAVLSLPRIGDMFARSFEGDLSYRVRLQSTRIAWESVRNYPFLGLGQDSSRSVTYQDMFGENFYPGDVGLLGVAFQWGLLGLLLYLLLTAWLFVHLLKKLWAPPDATGRGSAKDRMFLMALFIVCTTFIISSPVQVKLVKPEGLAIAAFCLGFIAAHRRTVPHRLRGSQRLPSEPALSLQVERRL